MDPEADNTTRPLNCSTCLGEDILSSLLNPQLHAQTQVTSHSPRLASDP